MAKTAIEEVLANWIRQAISPVGRFGAEVDPAEWVAAQFTSWWHAQLRDSIEQAEGAVWRARGQLMAMGDTAHLGEVYTS